MNQKYYISKKAVEEEEAKNIAKKLKLK